MPLTENPSGDASGRQSSAAGVQLVLRRTFGIRRKIKVFGSILFCLLIVVGGIAFGNVYRNVRAEFFYWFEISGQNLARSLSGNTLEFVFPYYEPTLDIQVGKAMEHDSNLLFCRVEFGENLIESREFGAKGEKDFRVFRDVVADNTGSPISAVTIHYSTHSIEQKLTTLILVIGFSALVAFVLAVLVLDFFLSRHVTRPLRKLAESTGIVAQGNLRHDVGIETGDEMEQVAGAFNLMTANLRTTVERITVLTADLADLGARVNRASAEIHTAARHQAELLGRASESIGQMDEKIQTTAGNVENLTAAIGQSASSTVQMSASVGQVTHTMGDLARSVDVYASTIEQLAASVATVAEGISLLDSEVVKTSEELQTIDDSLHGVSDSARRSEQLSLKVSELVTAEGRDTVRRAVEGFQNIRDAVDEGVSAITRLGADAQGIGSVVDVISDLADQTNLLSLNAAIIAAQAGEHGRSFAVVADEIRELAERTSTYLGEISQNIRNVQGQAGKAVATINRGSRTVDEGLSLIGEVDKTFRNVAAHSAEAARAAQDIAEASARSASSVETIAQAGRQMAAMSREIATATREQAMGTRQMLHEVNGMHAMAMQVNQAMREQEGAAQMISASAESARAMTEQIREATVDETRHSLGVVQAIEQLTNASTAGLAAVNELQEMVGSVNRSTAELVAYLKRFKT